MHGSMGHIMHGSSDAWKQDLNIVWKHKSYDALIQCFNYA